MIIGLTGRYCAGKNHIASILEAKGLPVLDVDKLGYEALESEKETIFSQFGADLKKADGALDRRLLGERVFGDKEKLAALEAIVHPAANVLTEKWIASQNGSCVINAALLHRSSVLGKLEKIIVVTAPFLIRFIRAKKRDKLAFSQIIKRFTSQKDFNTQYYSTNAEIYRVGNSGFSGSRKLERLIEMITEGIK